jgi:1-acyl-sn-glycerol-3-phosphate acyltransferase
VSVLRVLWRVPACALVTFFFAALTPAARLLSGDPARVASLQARLSGRWGRALCAILGVERTVEGSIPNGRAFLVASNHVSYLDILVLGSIYPSLFVAKREIATWPLFGWVARGAGTIFIDRERPKDVVRAGREMAKTLTVGVSLTIFPEGRSSDGAAILPFLPSLLEPAAQAGVPCYAATINYETPGSARAPSDTVCWHDGSSFPGHFVRLAGLPRIDARVRFASAPVTSDDRKELARTLWENANSGFEPIRQT